MLPMGLACLICFSFSGMAGGGWFRLEIVGCNGGRFCPQDCPLLWWCPWLSVLLVAVTPVTPNASPSTFMRAGFFSKASPQAFPPNPASLHAEWLPHCTSCAGVRHGFYSHPRASQDLPGPWCAQEGLLQLFGGPPCASTMLSRIALQPFLYSHSLQYVGLLKALGGLESALCSL